MAFGVVPNFAAMPISVSPDLTLYVLRRRLGRGARRRAAAGPPDAAARTAPADGATVAPDDGRAVPAGALGAGALARGLRRRAGDAGRRAAAGQLGEDDQRRTRGPCRMINAAWPDRPLRAEGRDGDGDPAVVEDDRCRRARAGAAGSAAGRGPIGRAARAASNVGAGEVVGGQAQPPLLLGGQQGGRRDGAAAVLPGDRRAAPQRRRRRPGTGTSGTGSGRRPGRERRRRGAVRVRPRSCRQG